MHVLTYIPYGADGIIVRIEADIRRGIPGIDISGLAEGAVREAKERVRAAFRNSGFQFPQDRVLINLAPAGVKKDGAALDLPIALAIMAASGHLPPLNDFLVMGELELSGEIRPVRGVLAATAAGLKEGAKGFIVPKGNYREAAILAPSMSAAPFNLYEAVEVLRHWAEMGSLPPCNIDDVISNRDDDSDSVGDFSEVQGQERYKRALEIASAGGHNLLVFGPPGAGKTMLARRLPSIMPRLTKDEAVEVTRLHSLAGQLKNEASLIDHAPFRSPHHSASMEGLMGGGRTVKPGEISLAHNGVLFLDEGTEFKKNVLQSLREPLEDGHVTISRADGPVRLPADFQLIIAANTCPCGRLGIHSLQHYDNSHQNFSGKQSCVCTVDEVYRYWRKFGSALLDRTELRVGVLPPRMISGISSHENSANIAARTARAISIQQMRFKNKTIRRNSRIPPGMISQFCLLENTALNAFNKATELLTLSGRACHSILKVSRTIADLEGSEEIKAVHVLEAVEHRRLGDDPYDILSIDQ
ncbi:MAG: YifB family Mg chelatase-like AAA ATPase [Treponema sp.]|jgi:magnesium chelatase family protein|nr:YifB family Mg chelatase-like AAA ATPase [Treponema sp.]